MSPQSETPRVSDPLEIAAYLRDHPITRGLDPDAVRELAEAALVEHHAAGDTLIQEGTRNRRLQLLVSGAADVYKADDVTGIEHVVNHVPEGSTLGEMSLFQEQVASATVRASVDTVTLVFSHDVVSRAALGATYDVLRANIGEQIMDRQRRSTENLVESLRASLKQETERREFGVLVSVIVILVGINQSIAEISHRTDVDIASQSFSWGGLAAFGIPLAYFVWKTRQPLSVFGLTLRGWKRSLAESLGIAVPLVAAAIGAKALFVQLGLTEPQPLFTLRTFYETSLFFPGLAGVLSSRALGFLHHATQEFLMRGVVQGALYRLYSRESPLSAILATSAIFATAHLFIGVPLALMTFAGGAFFGWLYARHGTLVGVTVLHFILHTTMKFLGYL